MNTSVFTVTQGSGTILLAKCGGGDTRPARMDLSGPIAMHRLSLLLPPNGGEPRGTPVLSPCFLPEEPHSKALVTSPTGLEQVMQSALRYRHGYSELCLL